MPRVRFTPGLVTPDQAAELTAAAALAAETADALARLTDEGLDEFPAKLTAYDSATGRFSWTEQWYDANGRRTDHPSPRTGTAAHSPAYAVGNGAVPPPAFPVEVLCLRRRVVATDPDSGESLGVVYEFDWNCACAVSGSGAGSGGGGGTGVVTECGTYSTVLVMTVSLPAGAGGGSAVVDVEWDGTEWVGTGEIAGSEVTVTVECLPEGGGLVPTIDVTTPGGSCTLGGYTSSDFSTETNVNVVGNIGIDCGSGTELAPYSIVEG